MVKSSYSVVGVNWDLGRIFMERIWIFSIGKLLVSVFLREISSRISIPEMTCPKTVSFPFRSGILVRAK